MDGGKRVWVPHPIEGFKLGTIVDIGAETITVEPIDGQNVSTCRHPGYAGGPGPYQLLVVLKFVEDTCINVYISIHV